MTMIGKRLPLFALAPLVLALGGTPRPAAAQDQHVTSPEEFFGFRLGADRKMARWDRMVEYYQLLGKTSDKLQVVNLGPSTMGNPFLLVIISSPANLARLEELRQVNAKISGPRGIPETEVRKLVAEGRAVGVECGWPVEAEPRRVIKIADVDALDLRRMTVAGPAGHQGGAGDLLGSFEVRTVGRREQLDAHGRR